MENRSPVMSVFCGPSNSGKTSFIKFIKRTHGERFGKFFVPDDIIRRYIKEKKQLGQEISFSEALSTILEAGTLFVSVVHYRWAAFLLSIFLISKKTTKPFTMIRPVCDSYFKMRTTTTSIMHINTPEK